MGNSKTPRLDSDQVRAWMDGGGRRYTWLADQLGVSAPVLYERLKADSLLDVAKLARIMGVDPHSLIVADE